MTNETNDTSTTSTSNALPILLAVAIWMVGMALGTIGAGMMHDGNGSGLFLLLLSGSAIPAGFIIPSMLFRRPSHSPKH